MEMFRTILKNTVEILRDRGHKATFEYPGYIAIGNRSYGTANGNWGWSDEDGNGGETNLSGKCAQPDLIADEIGKIETKAKQVNEEAFLEEVAGHLRTDACLDAEVSHTGGGIFCVDIKFNGGVMLRFGTSGENWGADIYVNGDFLEGQSIYTARRIDFSDASRGAVDLMEEAMAFDKQKWNAAADQGLANQSAQIEKVSGLGIEEFWTVVAANFPEVTTGDFPPDLTMEFKETTIRMIRHWLKFNR